MTDNSRLSELEPYIPSSSEKKQAVMMYMVAGLILSMWKREVSPFTHHHIKQSLWWLVSLVLIVFADFLLFMIWVLFAAVSWLIFSFFAWVAFLITLPIIIVGIMWIHQATKWKYVWENEHTNKFFALFSGIANRVLNLFDANHYRVIDAERYRAEDQFYAKPNKEEKVENSESSQTSDANANIAQNQGENWNSAVDSLDIQNHEINNETIEAKNLDNDQQISINNQDIWVDLSSHEINNEWDFKLDL